MTDTDLEQRLRGALSARAAAVTSRDLRHEPAPSRTARPSAPARWWLPLTAGVAAAAVTITAFAVLRPTDPAPTPPASPPSPAPSVEHSPSTSPAARTTSPAAPATSPATRTTSPSPTARPSTAPAASPSSSSIADATPSASKPAATIPPTPR
ncbi:cytoskeletal protein RodZ [Actinoplanes octamycinicus]|uniref:Cytoskeletal protein RodZ n=1 Tax=Actinoplanes octamycinicus TaxID=135948 RepID=A0A7W7H142_9ACTN|nr:hypothetical protein [Actinoplanes octamycinicus]MBB4742003.1 cytoskeletal protein RodZ [Actinoplanes octamycinicus]GIE60767.1 hypothetical protein Aoc01nite_61690 [Actinoplanes octamycinicus]